MTAEYAAERALGMAQAQTRKILAELHAHTVENARLTALARELADALDWMLNDSQPWWCDDCGHRKCVAAREHMLVVFELLHRPDVRVLLDREDQA